MNKGELIEALAERTELTKAKAEQTLNAFISIVVETVAKKPSKKNNKPNFNKIQLIGFGTFEPRKRNKRKGKNPQTGEVITIPATTVPAFRPGKAFKDAVQSPKKK